MLCAPFGMHKDHTNDELLCVQPALVIQTFVTCM